MCGLPKFFWISVETVWNWWFCFCAAENDPHDDKRKCEALWPIFKDSPSEEPYIFDLCHRRKEISKRIVPILFGSRICWPQSNCKMEEDTLEVYFRLKCIKFLYFELYVYNFLTFKKVFLNPLYSKLCTLYVLLSNFWLINLMKYDCYIITTKLHFL